MLFSVDSEGNKLKKVTSNWNPKELDIERYIVEAGESEILNSYIFGEDLLIVSNQIQTATKKRADILALDTAGRGVVIELKRDEGTIGIETQALQYLADFSAYRGENFIRRFANNGIEEKIFGFLGNNIEKNRINDSMRIILMARNFDPALLAIGEWFASNDVPFRCIRYTPIELQESRYLSFSVVFDRSVESLYPLIFRSKMREPGFYWHNISYADARWWQFLVKNSVLPACFDSAPGDPGERIMKSYIKGDTVLAYASGYGCIGWGTIDEDGEDSYKLLPLGDPDDVMKGDCRHRRKINWKATAKKLSDALHHQEIKNSFGIYHPIQTRVSIEKSKGKQLVEKLSNLFNCD